MHGFRSTAGGNPLDSFGRNLYVDTFNSAYGAGWKRENSFLMHKNTGTFCYGFYPHGSRPAGHGERYRATIIGPGVTPDVMWQGDSPGAYDETLDRRARRGAARDVRVGSPLQARLTALSARSASALDRGMIAAVIFDMDGVIVDTEHVWDEVREELVADWGGTYSPEAQQAMMGMSSVEWSAYMHDELGLAAEPGGDQRRGRAADARALSRRPAAHRRRGRRRPRARSRSFPLAVASSSNRPLIDAVLETAGIAACFAATVSSEEVARGKPSPDVYLEAARRLGVEPARAPRSRTPRTGSARRQPRECA